MKAIILGAGEGFSSLDENYTHPKAIHEIAKGKKVLDVLIENFQKIGVDELIFIGGYQVEKIIANYPQIKSYYNPDWENSNMVQSLIVAEEELQGEVFICYADTMFSSEGIAKLTKGKENIRIGIDTNWLNRFEGRGTILIEGAEKAIAHNNLLLSIETNKTDESNVSGEFTGLVYLNDKGSCELKNKLQHYLKSNPLFIKTANLSKLLNELLKENIVVETIDISGHWAELEAPQDIAQFVFGTKAETLKRLQNKLVKSKIESQVSFTYKKWKQDPSLCIAEIQANFTKGKIVVRSSAIGEDSFISSNAGEFLSLLNVEVSDKKEVESSIERVFESYKNSNLNHQCLIQPQLVNVISSGVVFTRDLETGAPYYIINYEKSERTDSVTSGTSSSTQTFVYYKFSSIKFDDEMFNQLIAAIREVEKIVGYDSLDIEFAFTDKGLHILQVRPLVANRKNRIVADEDFVNEINSIKEFVNFVCSNNELGININVLANMPDWNPAEIIGIMPKPLALSLYQHLITDEIWRVQRVAFGYRDSFPVPLVLSISGQPYINTKGSFNSFIPETLSEKTALKLLEYYLVKLKNNPHLHDKVEFEIAYTCFSFDLMSRLESLIDFGFSKIEIDEIYECLRKQTKNLLLPENKVIENELLQVEKLKNKSIAIFNATTIFQKNDILVCLLEDAKKNGTLPFAKLARLAFIATDILKSFVRLNIFTKSDYDTFLNSIETVASDFSNDLDKVKEKKIDLATLLEKYGHLRPGTYDITSKRYDEAPEIYFSNLNSNRSAAKGHISFALSSVQKEKIQQLIVQNDLGISVEELFRFIRLAIVNREYSKFEFTKNVSFSISLISQIAKELSFTDEDISFVPIDFFIGLTKSNMSMIRLRSEMKGIIKRNKLKYNITRSLKLPHLIKNTNDIELFWLEDGKPNFISEKSVIQNIICLNAEINSKENIEGKIVLIENADPGFDWIFGHDIKGLITVYGGANSHMAIRAAEFGLPAAIGCGEKIAQKLRSANTVELNCSGRVIQVLS